MAISKLIEHQTIKIDTHKSGSENKWEPGIHLHKWTNRKVNGRDRKVNMRVPLDRNAKPGNGDSEELFKEVRDVLKKDRKKFEKLIKEIKKDLGKNYSVKDQYILEQASKNIAGYFGLDIIVERSVIKLSKLTNKIQKHAVLVKSKDGVSFYVYLRFDKDYVQVGENDIRYFERYIVPYMNKPSV